MNLLKRALIGATLGLSALVSACDEEKQEKVQAAPQTTMVTLDDYIQATDSVPEAQDYINQLISYDSHRWNTMAAQPMANNGAIIAGGQLTFDKKKDICTGFSALGITLTKHLVGNGIDELYFCTLTFTSPTAAPHAVALYKQNGKWGKLGQYFDYEPATFNTEWDAGEDAADDFGTDLSGIFLYSTDLVDFRHGTNNGLVNVDPFWLKGYSEFWDMNNSITQNPLTNTQTWTGKSSWAAFTKNITQVYNQQLFKTNETSVQTDTSGGNYTINYAVTSQDANGQPLTAEKTDNSAPAKRWEYTWTYTPTNVTEREKYYENNFFTKEKHNERQLHSNGFLAEKHDYWSYYPNAPPWNEKRKLTYAQDGTFTGKYQDDDNDGVWVIMP